MKAAEAPEVTYQDATWGFAGYFLYCIIAVILNKGNECVLEKLPIAAFVSSSFILVAIAYPGSTRDRGLGLVWKRMSHYCC
jgi:hypothetical protein